MKRHTHTSGQAHPAKKQNNVEGQQPIPAIQTDLAMRYMEHALQMLQEPMRPANKGPLAVLTSQEVLRNIGLLLNTYLETSDVMYLLNVCVDTNNDAIDNRSKFFISATKSIDVTSIRFHQNMVLHHWNRLQKAIEWEQEARLYQIPKEEQVEHDEAQNSYCLDNVYHHFQLNFDVSHDVAFSDKPIDDQIFHEKILACLARMAQNNRAYDARNFESERFPKAIENCINLLMGVYAPTQMKERIDTDVCVTGGSEDEMHVNGHGQRYQAATCEICPNWSFSYNGTTIVLEPRNSETIFSLYAAQHTPSWQTLKEFTITERINGLWRTLYVNRLSALWLYDRFISDSESGDEMESDFVTEPEPIDIVPCISFFSLSQNAPVSSDSDVSIYSLSLDFKFIFHRPALRDLMSDVVG